MAFKKGKSGNSNGRPQGAKNKVDIVTPWKDFGEEMLTVGMDKYRAWLLSLPPDKFAQRFEYWIEFFKPRLARVEHGIDAEQFEKIEIAIVKSKQKVIDIPVKQVNEGE
jgi:hypothetical protein